jgi:hypothetical protein
MNTTHLTDALDTQRSWVAASEIIYDARVALHPLTVGFAEVAGVYDRGRPEYAPAVVGAIAAELGIPPSGPVLDLAADLRCSRPYRIGVARRGRTRSAR